MKIVIFQGGLGNQIFHYLFYQYVINNIDRKVFAVVRDGNNHNGYEIDRYFDVEIKLSDFLGKLVVWLDHNRNRFRGIFRNFYLNEFQRGNMLGFIYDGYWQNKKYFMNTSIKFRDLNLSDRNNVIKNKMLCCNSVAIHIRRGDYLQPPHNKLFAGICTLEYYQNAIEKCKSQCEDLVYFIFSDDIPWAKNNLKQENAYYIDWNIGNDSIYDMYLMSHAKMNIIANSTFSFWGAFLNKQSCMTIYPQKWFNEGCGVPVPDIFPDAWIGI